MRPLYLAWLPTLLLCSHAALSQTPTPRQTGTDVYTITFVKAAPGQAAAALKELQQQDPKDPMAGHYLLLRHQEGDEWDYCIIQHVGAKGTVDLNTAPATPRATWSWHGDSYVAGPSWSEFTRALLPAAADGKPNTSVYVVGAHRAVPGHYPQMLEILKQTDTNAKVPVSSVLFTHLSGGRWQVLSVDRYNSWQDLGASRSAAMSGSGSGWLNIRQHSAHHVDTIADRVMPQ